MTALGEELLVVSLSPAEGRNTRRHSGIRAALCAAAVLDGWATGMALPPEKELRKYVRKHNHATLEPALAALSGTGRVTTTRRLAMYDWLADPASGAAIRERLTASLSSPSAPAPHDAALAVLLYSGELWDWAFGPPVSKEGISWRSRPWPGTLWERAAMLASGAVIPDGAAANDLPSVARVLSREIRDYGD